VWKKPHEEKGTSLEVVVKALVEEKAYKEGGKK